MDIETYTDLVTELKDHNKTMVDHWQAVEIAIRMFALESVLVKKAIIDFAPTVEKDFLLDVLSKIDK